MHLAPLVLADVQALLDSLQLRLPLTARALYQHAGGHPIYTLETLKALPNQQVTFEADLEQRSLVLTTETGMYKMAVDPPDDFPVLPTSTDSEIVIPVE